jgi:hypothetical protein
LVLENDGDAVIEGVVAELSLRGLSLVQGGAKTELKLIPPKKTTLTWTGSGR